MKNFEIPAHIDHTLLKQQATWEQIRALLDEGLKYKTASVCIPPSFVAQAREYLKGKLPICTVIGFPNGYQTTAVKAFEAADAVKNGADEIDMVINIGWAKEHRYEDILNEIEAVKKAAEGKLLKVIIETCLLTEEEKTALCGVINRSSADFIKTSTGFGGGGAVLSDIVLMKRLMDPKKKIKAAGGIRSLADAEAFLQAGAERLGTSSLVSLLKDETVH